MTGKKSGGDRTRRLWGLCLVLLWSCVVLLFIKTNGQMSVQELLRYQPKSKPMAIMAMCGLFLLKSVDFMIHSGVLYAIDGILFSLPAAFALNTLGNIIMSAVPYFIGRSLGAQALSRIGEKYPRFRELEHLQTRSTGVFTFMLRTLGLPIPIAGLYMGASRCSFRKYLTASVLGLTPLTVPYTMLGEGTGGMRSPILLIAIATELLLCAFTLLFSRHLKRKEEEKQEHAD